MTAQPKGSYDFAFGPDNVYGRALELLRRRNSARRPGEIHLDIGCGYGRIAEPLEAELGRGYIGLDDASDGLTSLAGRGFETHRLRLEGRDATLRQLEEIVAGRPVASISFLDTLEHLVDGDEVLAAIAEVARRHHALVVVSVPNVTHRDIGARLMFGLWNYTATGLLDRTHVRLFDQSLLLAALEKAGLPVIDRHDLALARSDQHFPSTHPALAGGAPLNGLLFEAARQAHPCSDVNQFIWLCAPSREAERETFLTVREPPRPLVSVIIRTQGRRSHTLEESLLCLAGQSDTDFEVLVIGHKLDPESLLAVQRNIEDTPEWLRRKIRLLRVEEGGRSRPLNVGFATANGRYIAILDDDDIPFANWIEEYRKLEARSPGSILRCVAVRQDVVNVEIGARLGLRAVGPLDRRYPAEYDFLSHLVENNSPNNTLAFPRGAFHDLGLQFDESLDMTEDWDYLLRVSACCGVVSSAEITGVYRWWVNHESSRTEHREDEWQANYEAILRKQDQSFFIVPKGGLNPIRRIIALAAAESAQEAALKEPPPPLASVEDAVYWGQELAAGMPDALAHILRKGLRRECARLRFRAFFSILSRKRRRRLRERLRIYLCFLKAFD